MTDEELVQRAVDGDSSAFDRLVDRHAAACLRFATRMLGDADHAQDVAQDTWVRVHRALATYQPGTAFRTWVFAILINRCRSAMSSRLRRERLVAADWSAVDAALHSAAARGEHEHAVLRIELQRAIARLSPDMREAFLLKHVEQLEYTDMADILGAGVSALKMRVQRACLQLRQDLQEYHHAS